MHTDPVFQNFFELFPENNMRHIHPLVIVISTMIGALTTATFLDSEWKVLVFVISLGAVIGIIVAIMQAAEKITEAIDRLQ